MNSRENFAMGAILSFDFNLGNIFGIGFVSTFSANFGDFYVIEPAAIFRWYFLSNENSSWFIQAEIGFFLIFEAFEFSVMPLGSIRAGCRLPLGKMFYIEPFGRVGYPFMFGIGTAAGVRINK